MHRLANRSHTDKASGGHARVLRPIFDPSGTAPNAYEVHVPSVRGPSPGRAASDSPSWRHQPPLYRVIDAVVNENAPVSGDDKLSAAARLVAIAVARRFNTETGEAWMSIADIAARTGQGYSTVQRALKELRNATPAIIAMRRRANTARNRRGVYEFRLVLNPERFTEARDRARACRFTPKHLRWLWNRAAGPHGLLVCKELTPEREAIAARAIAAHPSPSYWQDIIARAVDSDFMRGVQSFAGDGPSSPKGFDFLIRHHVQISEGIYQ